MENKNRLYCVTCNFEVDKSNMDLSKANLYWCENCKSFVFTHIDENGTQIRVWNNIYKSIEDLMQTKLIKHISINKKNILIDFIRINALTINYDTVINIDTIELISSTIYLYRKNDYIGLSSTNKELFIGNDIINISLFLRNLQTNHLMIDWSVFNGSKMS